MIRILIAIGLGLAGPALATTDAPVSPEPRPEGASLPEAQWDELAPKAEDWTRASLEALRAHGEPLVETVPDDIDAWCPAYDAAPPADRRAFWVGLLSALSKYESTWKPGAVGGDGAWFGLLQIAPPTARAYDCRATTGEALKAGPANLSCAIRIMAETVPRDDAIARDEDGPAGVAADWGPMTSAEKRRAMQNWLRRQDYCQLRVSLVPPARSFDFAQRKRVPGHLRVTSYRPAPRPAGTGPARLTELAISAGVMAREDGPIEAPALPVAPETNDFLTGARTPIE